jgi:hypothetical protein
VVFGLQAGGGCYLGTDLKRAQMFGAAKLCDAVCLGDSTQTCGGHWTNEVYMLAGRHLLFSWAGLG